MHLFSYAIKNKDGNDSQLTFILCVVVRTKAKMQLFDIGCACVIRIQVRKNYKNSVLKSLVAYGKLKPRCNSLTLDVHVLSEYK